MSEAQSRTVVIGISCAVGGSVMLSLNDLFIKQLSDGYALHQVILVRSIVAIAVILGFMGLAGLPLASLRTTRPWAHLTRCSVVMVSNVCFFLGLAAMPIADASAIGFVAPILVTMLSALVLGEQVGWHRWGAVICGLIGVIIMLRPEGELRWAAVLIVISAACYAITQNMTRHLKETESAVTINFYVQLAFIVVSVAMGLWVGDGHLAGSDDASLAFLPVDISDLRKPPEAQTDIPLAPWMVEVRWQNGRSLHFDGAMDAVLLARLIRVVETA